MLPPRQTRLETPLLKAEAAWRKEGNTARLGQVLALRSASRVWQGDLELAFAYARKSLELLPEHDVFWRSVSLLNVCLEDMLEGQIDSGAETIDRDTRAERGRADDSWGAGRDVLAGRSELLAGGVRSGHPALSTGTRRSYRGRGDARRSGRRLARPGRDRLRAERSGHRRTAGDARP